MKIEIKEGSFKYKTYKHLLTKRKTIIEKEVNGLIIGEKLGIYKDNLFLYSKYKIIHLNTGYYLFSENRKDKAIKFCKKIIKEMPATFFESEKDSKEMNECKEQFYNIIELGCFL